MAATTTATPTTTREPIVIDGSFGEGGGQILRSSLSLSIITGRPLILEKIRAGRAQPGLMRQHLTAVRAAAEICNAKVSGDEPGSCQLEFTPGNDGVRVRGGQEYCFDIGSAGSTTLVLQTVLLPLCFAKEPSKVVIKGGTHNMKAPPFDFISKSFLPKLSAMGVNATVRLIRPGFYPAGGGIIELEVHPVDVDGTLPLVLNKARDNEHTVITQQLRGRILHSKLPDHIANKERDVILEKLDLPPESVEIELVKNSPGPGNVVLLEIDIEMQQQQQQQNQQQQQEHQQQYHTEVISAFSQKRKKAEQVAMGAVEQAKAYLNSSAAVGEYLADQLLLPMALFSGGSFTTNILSEHTRTNMEVIMKFMPEINITSERIYTSTSTTSSSSSKSLYTIKVTNTKHQNMTKHDE